MKTDDEDEYRVPWFVIAKEDIGPLIGGVLLLFSTIAVVYYVYLGPSPFEKWFSMVNAKPAVGTVSHKPAPSMMPAESVSGDSSPGVSAASGAAVVAEEREATPAGSEAPEKPETPAPAGKAK